MLNLNNNLFAKGIKKFAVSNCRLVDYDNRIFVNGISFHKYFADMKYSCIKLDIFLKSLGMFESGIGARCMVRGSGKSSQLHAVLCSVAKCLKSKFAGDGDEMIAMRNKLRKTGYITVDTRRNEMKLYGRVKSRKLGQTSKR